MRDYALCSIQRLPEKAPKTTVFTPKGGFSLCENPPFGVKFLRVLRGLLSRSPLSGVRGKAPRPSPLASVQQIAVLEIVNAH